MERLKSSKRLHPGNLICSKPLYTLIPFTTPWRRAGRKSASLLRETWFDSLCVTLILNIAFFASWLVKYAKCGFAGGRQPNCHLCSGSPALRLLERRVHDRSRRGKAVNAVLHFKQPRHHRLSSCVHRIESCELCLQFFQWERLRLHGKRPRRFFSELTQSEDCEAVCNLLLNIYANNIDGELRFAAQY